MKGNLKMVLCTDKEPILLANGDKYVGEYKDGKQHGQGTYTYANGDKYVGEYKDGLPTRTRNLYLC